MAQCGRDNACPVYRLAYTASMRRLRGDSKSNMRGAACLVRCASIYSAVYAHAPGVSVGAHEKRDSTRRLRNVACLFRPVGHGFHELCPMGDHSDPVSRRHEEFLLIGREPVRLA